MREALIPPRRELRRFVIRHDERTWTINQERAWTWPQHRRITSEWRADWQVLGLSVPIPRMECVRVVATPIRQKGRSGRQDVGACMPAVKAAIDGLIDAGMCADDGPEHVVELVFRPPKDGKFHGLELVIEEV